MKRRDNTLSMFAIVALWAASWGLVGLMVLARVML